MSEEDQVWERRQTIVAKVQMLQLWKLKEVFPLIINMNTEAFHTAATDPKHKVLHEKAKNAQKATTNLLYAT